MTPERLAELQARASRPRRTVPVVCNGELAQRIDALQADLAAADTQAAGDRRLGSRGVASQAAEMEAQLDDLYQQAEDDTLLLVVEGLEGTTWRALLAAHPPKPAVEGEAKPPGWAGAVDALCDRESMEEPLIRLATIGMRATVDAKELDPLPDGTLDWLLGFPGDDQREPVPGFASVEQRETLFLAAWNCSRGDDAVPLRRRRSTTTTSDDGSGSPAPSVSRRAASTAGSRRRSTNTSTPTAL